MIMFPIAPRNGWWVSTVASKHSNAPNEQANIYEIWQCIG